MDERIKHKRDEIDTLYQLRVIPAMDATQQSLSATLKNIVALHQSLQAMLLTVDELIEIIKENSSNA